MIEGFWQIAAVGFAAQIVDGALGMAYGLTSPSLLLTLGYSPAAASAAVHLAETATTAASAISHGIVRNVDWGLVRPLAIAGVLGGVILWKAFRATPGIRPPRGLKTLGGIGGFLDAIGGGGWGPIVSGTLVASGGSARHMIGSAITAEFFMTTAITIAFVGHMGLGEFSWSALALVVGGLPAAHFRRCARRASVHLSDIGVTGRQRGPRLSRKRVNSHHSRSQLPVLCATHFCPFVNHLCPVLGRFLRRSTSLNTRKPLGGTER